MEGQGEPQVHPVAMSEGGIAPESLAGHMGGSHRIDNLLIEQRCALCLSRLVQLHCCAGAGSRVGHLTCLTVWVQRRADYRQPPDLSGALVSGRHRRPVCRRPREERGEGCVIRSCGGVVPRCACFWASSGCPNNSPCKCT